MVPPSAIPPVASLPQSQSTAACDSRSPKKRTASNWKGSAQPQAKRISGVHDRGQLSLTQIPCAAGHMNLLDVPIGRVPHQRKVSTENLASW